MKHSVKAGCAVLLAGWSAVAGAHHSFAMFDANKSVTLEGTFKTVEWTNPHSFFLFTAPGPDGQVKDWNIEAPSPNNLIRRGWKHTDVSVGDRVTLVMHPRKDGALGGILVSVRFANGKELLSGAGPPPPVHPAGEAAPGAAPPPDRPSP